MPRRPITLDAASASFASVEQLIRANPNQLQSGVIEVVGHQSMFFKWVNRNSDVTLVIFTATVPSHREISVPVFSGMRMSELLPWANVLMVADPAVELDEELFSGWHMGTHMLPDYQVQLASIIKSFSGDNKLVLFGGSAGGFAALDQGSRLPGSTVVAANPQTDVSIRGLFPTVMRKAWNRKPEDVNSLPARTSVVEAYKNPLDVRVIYLQNLGDSSHVERHWKPFIKEIHYGIPYLSLTPNIGRGHLVFDSNSTQRVLAIATRLTEWNEIKDKLNTIRFIRR